MKGTFTTTKFADRDALNAGRPSRVLVARNRFVIVGLEWMWGMLLGQLRNEQGGLSDHLAKGRLIVGDGDRPVTGGDERLAGANTAWAELDDGYPRIGRNRNGVHATFRATFTENEANFDWRERGVTSVQGVLIDRSVRHQGTKMPGTIWQLEAVLDLTFSDNASAEDALLLALL